MADIIDNDGNAAAGTMRAWLSTVPWSDKPPTTEDVFEARVILGCEILVAEENGEPVLAENLRKAYTLLVGPEGQPIEGETFARRGVGGCFNCGGPGVRCCEFGADRVVA